MVVDIIQIITLKSFDPCNAESFVQKRIFTMAFDNPAPARVGRYIHHWE
jgi:hypothetical protein